jgi:hypothetical protein
MLSLRWCVCRPRHGESPLTSGSEGYKEALLEGVTQASGRTCTRTLTNSPTRVYIHKRINTVTHTFEGCALGMLTTFQPAALGTFLGWGCLSPFSCQNVHVVREHAVHAREVTDLECQSILLITLEASPNTSYSGGISGLW